jgi:hypothetical protein
MTAVLVNRDTDLYDLTVKTGHGTEVIRTTASHLFWDPAARRWVTGRESGYLLWKQLNGHWGY